MPVEMRNTIFYHVPKTGGTALTSMLNYIGGRGVKPNNTHPFNLAKEHSTPGMYPSDKISFALFRNPADWYRSIWAYRTAAGWPEGSKSPMDRYKDPDFNVFIRNVMLDSPGYLGDLYSEFEDVDYKFKTEAFYRKLCRFLSENEPEYHILDRPLKLIRSNESPSYLKERAVYNMGMRDRLLRVEHRAVEIWKNTL
jgi:hypothetical protein